MGLGKSLISYMYADRNPDKRPVIIVCPKTLKWNWLKEIKKHFGVQADILGTTKPDKYSLNKQRDTIIINYDVLGPWLPYLRSLNPQIIILDEVSLLGNQGTKRTRNVKMLCKGTPHVLALSGTPLTNRPAEMWPVLKILRPKLFPAFYDYAQKYCDPRRKPWGWEYKGATNLGELHQILVNHVMIRRRKMDVLSQLPGKIRSVVPLGIVGRKEYEHAEDDLISWLLTVAPHRARRAALAEQMVKLGYLRRLSAEKKLPAVMDWVDDFLIESDGKLILFAIHEKIINALRQRYHRECVVIDGSVSDRNRRIAEESFQTNPQVRLFIGNIDAAGVGLNFTISSTVAFAEYPWVPAKLTQAEDRAHRIGQRNVVNVYYLVARGTIEEYLLEVLQTKQRVLNQVLDGEGKGDDLNVYEALCQKFTGQKRYVRK
jgi:SWI/SNF-related matrix-associated actin-dependent regulator 1 of chromatin subfamily A